MYDLITMGRVGVDFYPEQSGLTLAEIKSFAKFLGGTATNTAVACARYGRKVAVITKVGDDGFGDYVRKALRGFDVDDRFVGTDPALRTPVVFVEVHPPDRFPILFYREPKAPDMNLDLDELDLDAIANARIFWTTGTGLAEEPSLTATLAALEIRGERRRAATIHDLDFRPTLWRTVEDAGPRQRNALRLATIAVGNLEECAIAVGEGTADEVGGRILDLGVEVAIVKRGAEGATAYMQDGQVTVAAVPIEVVNGLGAGDAFGGALCHGLLSGWDWGETIRFANAAGAYVAGQLACADAMPNESQVREIMANA